MEYPNKEKTNKVNRNLQHEKKLKNIYLKSIIWLMQNLLFIKVISFMLKLKIIQYKIFININNIFKKYYI